MPLFDSNGHSLFDFKTQNNNVLSPIQEDKTTTLSENVLVQEQTISSIVSDISTQVEETQQIERVTQQEEIKPVEIQQENLEKVSVQETVQQEETTEEVIQPTATYPVENMIQDKPVEEVIQQESINIAETTDISQQATSPSPVETLDVSSQEETIENPSIDTTNTISNYSSSSLGIIDGISLMQMEFPPPVIIVENLLNSGLSVLAGMPKVGKSWFCLQLCLCVANGQDMLGLKTNKSEVLYLSFESKVAEIQLRLKKLLQDEPMPDGIHFYDERKTLDDGLLDLLQETVDKNSNIKLIIIDTLQFIRSNKTGGGTLYQKEYKEMSKLKAFADKNKLCILAVHHLKNQPAKDVFAQMYGSNGIRGATDTNIVLSKLEENNLDVLLAVESRDFESTSKIIQRDDETCRWEVVEDNVEEMEYINNPIVITIKALLQENPDGIEKQAQEIKDKMCQDLGISEGEYAPQSISREISEHLIPLLMRYDNIRCKKLNTNGGKKGRKWYFYYQQDDNDTGADSNIAETNTAEN